MEESVLAGPPMGQVLNWSSYLACKWGIIILTLRNQKLTVIKQLAQDHTAWLQIDFYQFPNVYHVISSFWCIWNYIDSSWGLVCVRQVLCKMSVWHCLYIYIYCMRHRSDRGWPSPGSGGSLGKPGGLLGHPNPVGCSLVLWLQLKS